MHNEEMSDNQVFGVLITPETTFTQIEKIAEVLRNTSVKHIIVMQTSAYDPIEHPDFPAMKAALSGISKSPIDVGIFPPSDFDDYVSSVGDFKDLYVIRQDEPAFQKASITEADAMLERFRKKI